jgi:hypothetical protein
VAAGALFLAIRRTIGLRVSPEEEVAGLDVEEHGSPGYSQEAPVSSEIESPVAALEGNRQLEATERGSAG